MTFAVDAAGGPVRAHRAAARPLRPAHADRIAARRARRRPDAHRDRPHAADRLQPQHVRHRGRPARSRHRAERRLPHRRERRACSGSSPPASAWRSSRASRSTRASRASSRSTRRDACRHARSGSSGTATPRSPTPPRRSSLPRRRAATSSPRDCASAVARLDVMLPDIGVDAVRRWRLAREVALQGWMATRRCRRHAISQMTSDFGPLRSGPCWRSSPSTFAVGLDPAARNELAASSALPRLQRRASCSAPRLIPWERAADGLLLAPALGTISASSRSSARAKAEPTPGYGPLAMLPVAWVALVLGRRAVLVARRSPSDIDVRRCRS